MLTRMIDTKYFFQMKVTREKKENVSTHHMNPAKYVQLDPQEPLVKKVPPEHQVHLENVVILVNKERREIKEHLVPLEREGSLVQMAKMVYYIYCLDNGAINIIPYRSQG